MKPIIFSAAIASLAASQALSMEASCGNGHVVANGSEVHFVDTDGNKVEVYEGKYEVEAIAHSNGGVVTVFRGDHADWAYFSPDCLNVGGGGRTERVYGGDHRNVGLVTHPSGRGVLATWRKDNGLAWTYYSPDGKNVGGGGATQRVQF